MKIVTSMSEFLINALTFIFIITLQIQSMPVMADTIKGRWVMSDEITLDLHKNNPLVMDIIRKPKHRDMLACLMKHTSVVYSENYFTYNIDKHTCLIGGKKITNTELTTSYKHNKVYEDDRIAIFMNENLDLIDLVYKLDRNLICTNKSGFKTENRVVMKECYVRRVLP